jgi:hypothetical protein
MSIAQIVVCVLAGLGFVGLFAVIVRGQLTNDRAIRGMLLMHKDLMEQHGTVLEHLMIASDPDAWREKQVDKFRKERDAKRAESATDGKPLPPKRGVD